MALGTQGYGNASWRYLHGRSVQVTKEEEWLWFDVTDVVKQWLSSSGKSGGGGGLVPVSPPPQPHAQGPPMALLTTPRNPAESLGMFKLSVHCPCEQGPGATNNMRITIEGTAVLGGGVCVGSPVSPSPVPALLPTGFEQQRGDMQGIAKKRRRVPYVLAMSLPPDRANDLHSSRRRRALDAEYCFGSAPRPPHPCPGKPGCPPKCLAPPRDAQVPLEEGWVSLRCLGLPSEDWKPPEMSRSNPREGQGPSETPRPPPPKRGLGSTRDTQETLKTPGDPPKTPRSSLKRAGDP